MTIDDADKKDVVTKSKKKGGGSAEPLTLLDLIMLAGLRVLRKRTLDPRVRF